MTADSKTAVTDLRINIGRQVLNALEDLSPVKATWPENMWHELIGQQVIDIVDTARKAKP